MGSGELAIRELGFEATFEASTLVLTGNADGSVSAQLHELVRAIHAAATGSIAVDLRGLEFMAASCFNVLVTWVNLIGELPADRRYELRFAIAPKLPWQKRSLATLTRFAPAVVKVS